MTVLYQVLGARRAGKVRMAHQLCLYISRILCSQHSALAWPQCACGVTTMLQIMKKQDANDRGSR